MPKGRRVCGGPLGMEGEMGNRICHVTSRLTLQEGDVRPTGVCYMPLGGTSSRAVVKRSAPIG